MVLLLFSYLAPTIEVSTIQIYWHTGCSSKYVTPNLSQNKQEEFKMNQENAQEETFIIDKNKITRPWGDYQCIDHAQRYQVKHITVNQNAQLSLQMHNHRAEHWIIVKGTALVTCGEETFLLTENQSTYIPIGEKHRLENPGKIPLEMIEVQSGSYLGEDDIVRFEDIYGRAINHLKEVKSNSQEKNTIEHD